MLKRSCEESKIIVEETLSNSLFSVEKIKEGKQSFILAISSFLELADQERTSMTHRVPNLKIKESSGIVVLGLKNIAEALSFLVKDINFWIIDFLDALNSEHDWLKNLEVIKSLYKLLSNAIDELKIENAIRNKISEENKMIILNTLKSKEDSSRLISPPKSCKLSLKKRRRKK